MQIMACEIINPLLEIRLKYGGNMKFTLRYGTARFKLEVRGLITCIYTYFVNRVEYFFKSCMLVDTCMRNFCALHPC